MEIIETAPFARCRDELLDDEQFRRLQEHLVLNLTPVLSFPADVACERFAGWVQGAVSGVVCE